MIKSNASSCKHQNSSFEACRRKYKIITELIREADHLLKNNSFDPEAKTLPWESFATQIRAEVWGNTIRSTIEAYGKRLACVKRHQIDKSNENRVEWTTWILADYPEEEWRHIRFSDEIHFEHRPEVQLRIIQKPNTRYRYEIQHGLEDQLRITQKPSTQYKH